MSLKLGEGLKSWEPPDGHLTADKPRSYKITTSVLDDKPAAINCTGSLMLNMVA